MVYKLPAHLTFVTKPRKKVMTDRITDKLRSAFEEVGGLLQRGLWRRPPLDVIKAYLEGQRAPNRPKGRPKSKA